MTGERSYPVTTPLRERIALILLSRRGFGFYLDPMEGGQDAYDLTMEALDEADAIISVLPDGVAQPSRNDALRLLSDLFSESVHETWSKEEIVNIIEDAISVGSPLPSTKLGGAA